MFCSAGESETSMSRPPPPPPRAAAAALYTGGTMLTAHGAAAMSASVSLEPPPARFGHGRLTCLTSIIRISSAPAFDRLLLARLLLFRGVRHAPVQPGCRRGAAAREERRWPSRSAAAAAGRAGPRRGCGRRGGAGRRRPTRRTGQARLVPVSLQGPPRSRRATRRRRERATAAPCPARRGSGPAAGRG